MMPKAGRDGEAVSVLCVGVGVGVGDGSWLDAGWGLTQESPEL